MKQFLGSLFLLLFMAFPAHSAFNPGVKEGEKIPHTLEAIDQKGKTQSFETLKGRKGMVILFIRSIDWCPFCKIQMKDFSIYARDFKIAGFPVVAITYDKKLIIGQYAERENIKFPILHDKDSEIIKAFGIMNQKFAERKRHYAHGIPYPAIFIVEADGTIYSKFIDEGYKDRPRAEFILEYLEGY